MADAPISRKAFAALVRDYSGSEPKLKPPHCEILRDVRIVGGEVCRLTMGGIVLCEAAGNPIFSENGADDEMSVVEAFWLLQDRNLDDAVWLVEDKKALRRRVAKYALGFSNRAISDIIGSFSSWLNDVADSLPRGEGGGGVRRADWYIDAIDQLAHEYGWTDEFIMWQLSWVRNVRLRESIVSRRNNKPIIDIEGIDGKLELLLSNAEGSTNGEG